MSFRAERLKLRFLVWLAIWSLTTMVVMNGVVMPGAASAAGTVTLRSVSTLVPPGATRTFAMPKPASLVAGDVMVASLSLNNGGAVTLPSGWTLIATTQKGAVRQWSYYRVATASEPATYTWTSASTAAGVAGIAAYVGVDPVTPLTNFSSASGTSAQATAPAVAASASSVALLLLTIDGAYTGTPTYPASFTTRWALTDYQRGFAADNLTAASGTLPAATFVIGSAQSWAIQQVALRVMGPAPTVSSVTPSGGSTAGGTTVTVNGTGFQTGATVSFGGSALAVTTVTPTGITGTTTAHASGAVNVVVTNRDAQSGTCTGCFAYATPAPAVTSVTPNSGLISGGTTVTIAGSDFQAGATVSFGGSALTISTINATTITGTTTAHAPGAVSVVVTNPDAQSATCANCFTYAAATPGPTVTSVAPSSGDVAGGTGVTITGSDFQTGASASFGGSALTVSTINATTITGTTTAHAAGAVSVVVTNPDAQSGTCTSCFTYVAPAPPPTVTSVTPNTGAAAGGTSVTIAGSDFVAGASVSFGGSALTVGTINATTITGTTNAHAAGLVNVTVTNPDAQSASCAGCFTYVAPAPTVTSVTPNSGPTAGGTSVTVTGTGFSAGATVSIGGSALTALTIADTSITGTTAAHAAGLVNVVVTNADAQNATCTGCFTYLAPAPTVSSVTPATGAIAGGTSVTVNGTGFLSGATVSFGGSVLTVSTISSTAITGTTAAHDAGAVSVTVTNADIQSGTCSGCFTYLAPAPTVSSVAPASGPVGGGASVTISGTAFQSGATVSFGGSALTVSNVSSTSITGTTTAHAAGTVSLTVANPDAQNATCSGCFSYVAAPVVTSVAPNSGDAAGGTSVTINGSGFQSGATVSFGGSSLTVSTIDPTSITGTTTAHAAGAVSVVVTNADGQSGTCSGCFTYVAAPAVTSVTPNSGPSAGGTTVTVAGTNFVSGSSVSFAGSPLTVSAISPTSITGTTTAHAAGVVNVTVANPDGQNGSCSDCFTYVAGPTVNAVTPTSGPSVGGTSVTVTGTGFVSGATVSFGGSALSIATVGATSITGTTTAHSAGAVNVVVTNPDTQTGTCSSCFTYVAAPAVTSVTPNSGPAAGGTSVTIAGTGFQTGATVSFGGSALTVSTVSSTTITGTTTAHAAGAVNVTVTNTDAQSASCTGCFTYVVGPAVTSVTPNSGPAAGGTSVTINGSGFQAGATASFGGAAVTISGITATTITGTTTSHGAGAVNVVVTNADTQSGTCTGCFTYVAAPTVSSVSANAGPAAGGTSVTISGTGFQSGAVVSFGGSTLTVATISSSSITGTTTAHAAGAVNVTVTNPDAQAATCSGCFTYVASPSVPGLTPTSGAAVGGTTVTITGTDFQAGATVSFGGSALTVSAISATSIAGTTTAHAAGSVNVVVTNPDAQTGTCAGCFTYVAGPAVTSVAPSSGPSAGGTTVTVSGSGFQAGTTVSFGGSALSISTINATSITGSTSAHAAGGVNVIVTNPDAQSGTCTGCFTYVAAPTVASVTPNGGPSAGGAAVTIAGTGFQSGSSVSFGGSPVNVSTISATSITGTTTAHAAGSVSAVVTNPDGQSGNCSSCFTYVAAPAVASVTPNSGPTAGGTSVTVNGSGFQSGATVSFGGSALTVATISASAITGTTTAHAAGAVNVTVTNPDAQSGACSGCFTYIAPAPTVTSVAPTSGSIAGGTSVTITGTGFQSGATVSFGGSALTVSTVSPTTIAGTTTAHAAGTTDVVVTNPDSQSATCLGCFTYLAAAPTVSSVAPTSGPAVGGTAVTISGSGFQTGATINFGGSTLTVSTISATTITGTTTARAAGSVNVIVTNPDTQSGSCTGCFTYVAAPTVSSVTPNSGPSAGGTSVTVAGTNFQAGATVSFAGSALTVSTVNPTSITGVTTAHATGPVNIVVTNPDAQSASCTDCFTYVAAPAITSVTPNNGPSAGGTSVSVAGSGFQTGATVSFGGSALTVATINATTITGTTTAHAAGSISVAVTNPDGQSATCSSCFTYVAPAPTVASFAPTTGAMAGGTAVTITGTGFQTGATVSLGGSALTVSTTSSTSITGTTGAHAAGTVNVVVTNPDSQSATCTGCFTYLAPAPTVSSIAPASGSAGGGTNVTVAGSGFQTGATVSFGGSALTDPIVSPTSITGTTTAHAAGAVSVVVTNPDTQSGSCSGCFTYVAAPTVASVTPNLGPSSGGTSVTVAGTGFVSGSNVSFGGSPLNVSTISATTITGTTTAHAAGAVSVVVTNPDTQSATCTGCFTYIAAPAVSSVTPTTGPASGGTLVTIAGTGFQAGATVSFGGSALTVSTISPTSITGVTTAHAAGSANVVVTNPDTQTGTCSSCFTYVAAPTVASITPTSGPTAGGTSVTIAGSGFQTGATVAFGGAAFTVATTSPTAITGTTTSRAAGSVNVVVANPDGQSATCSGCFTYVAPAPTVTSVTPNTGAIAGGTSVTVAGTGFAFGATVSFGGSALTVATINATTITGTTTAHAAGSVTVTVTNADTQSGSCSTCFTYLAPTPAVTSVAPTSGATAGGTAVTISGSAFQAGAIVSFGGSALTIGTINATTITGTTTSHAAGSVNVTVTNPDTQAGTCSSCFIYVAAPTVTSVTPNSGPAVGGTSVSIAGTGFQAGASVSFGGSPLTIGTINATTITGTTTAHAADLVNVVVNNADTQSGSCSGCFTYIAAPAVASVTPNSGPTAGGTSVTVNGSGFQSGATVSFGGSAVTVATISASAITGTTTSHASGAVNVIVTNPDAQSGACSGCFTYIAPAPTVTSVAPTSGAIAGGTAVTITGTDFQSGATVSFGGSALTVSTIAPTSITGTTSAHAAGSVNVIVTNTDTQSGTCTGCFAYLAPAPTVSSIAPTSGPAAGGTSVTIAGSGFQSGATASLGGSPVTVSNVTGTSITGTTTAHAAGAVTATVMNPDTQSGTCAGCFTYVAAPTVTSVTPNSGPSAGGTSVTVAGSGFQTGATVSFGGSALTVATVNGTTITGTTTAHVAGSVNVVAINPDTQSGTCSSCFTYVAAPTVSSVTPSTGPAVGGTSVSIAGAGFQSGATVSFGGSALTVATISATTITGTPTAHAAGAVNVVVTNPDTQSGTCSSCFTYVAAPTVTSIAPNSGPAGGGTSVTITGGGFQSGATASLGGSPVTVTTITATSISGTTTAHATAAVNLVVTNPDTQSATCTGCYTYVAAPKVTSITPTSGTSIGGTAVTIAGTGFQSGATASLGGAAVTVSTVSATSITGTTSPHAAGAVTLIVTNPDTQIGTCVVCFTYVAPPPPTVTSVTPNSGPSAGGTSVTIAGSGFQVGATVAFGGSALTVSTINATTITGTTTAHAAGPVNVVVTNPDAQTGTCLNCFTYTAPANVTLRSTTTATGSISYVLAKPAGLAMNDVMVASVSVNAGSAVTAPTGWTLIAHTQGVGVVDLWTYYRAAGASEPASYTFAANSSATGVAGMAAYIGLDPVSPIAGFSSAATSGGSNQAIAPAVTTSAQRVALLLLTIDGGFNGTVTNPSGFTQRWSLTNYERGLAADNLTIGTGNLPAATFALSGVAFWSIQQVALKTAGPAAAPTATSVAPNSGSTTGGTSVTVTGTHFQPGATVSFGGSVLTVSTVTPTTITGTTTAHAAGAVAVTVTNADAQTGTCADCFTYVTPAPPPTVTSVSPNNGPAAGGTAVTVAGSGFQPGATVSFGGSALAVSTVSATSITGTTAAHAGGAVNVVVTNGDAQTGSCTSCFSYVAAPAPTISSVTPNNGTSAGGTPVTVAGTGFQTGATVAFGGASLTATTVNATSITGTTSVHAAGAVNVVVNNPDLQSATCTTCYTFTAAPPPTVSSVAPTNGSTSGGTSVTISGTGFQTSATVSFGGSPVSVVTLTPTTITGTTSAHAAGAVSVLVTNPDTQTGSCSACFTYVGTGNAIQSENALPGTAGWDDFATVLQDDAISGYGSKISVNHGDSIDLFITTTAASVSIDIFRTGWYGGVGARMVASLGSFPGRHQAIPLPDRVTGIIDCSATWTKTTTLTIPASWVTGVYLAKLTASSGNKSFIFFVVRNDGGHEDFAFQTSVTTYQAYNNWGGTSLYNNNTNKSVYTGPHAVKVSFDRPFNPGDGNGAGHYFWFEYPFVRWAESQGYDMTYITDVDTHTNVNPLTNHKAYFSVGHDEYWSKGMRDNVQAAINAGVNVAFFSANSAYWQIRFEPNAAGAPNRIEVGYKDFAIYNIFPGPDPMYGVNNAIVTNYWRDTPVNLPENGLLGVQFGVQVDADYAYVIQNASHWIYAGTGFVNGSRIPGIVGYEVDGIVNNGFSPPGLITLSSSPVNACCGNGSFTANSTIYTAASGARVFASGTIQWALGLDGYGGTTYVNAGLQRITTNIFNNFRGP